MEMIRYFIKFNLFTLFNLRSVSKFKKDFIQNYFKFINAFSIYKFVSIFSDINE